MECRGLCRPWVRFLRALGSGAIICQRSAWPASRRQFEPQTVHAG
jgi:hypothetical protein